MSIFKIEGTCDGSNEEAILQLSLIEEKRSEFFKQQGVLIKNSMLETNWETEISKYLSLKLSQPIVSLNNWWACQELNFPNLKQLYSIIEAISATSSSSEAAFSVAGRFVRADRAAMNPSKINQLCFIKANVKYMEEAGSIFKF